MPQKHIVKQGEDLDSIAFQYGFLPSTIWEHEKNDSLREKRDDPNVLKENDEIHIPDREQEGIEASSGARHTFLRKGTYTNFQIQLMDDDGEYCAGIPFTLNINTKRGNEIPPLSSRTDEEGFVKASIPADSTEGELILNPGTDYEEKSTFQLGYIDPANAGARGIQSMLNNLGYYCGEEDDEIGDLTRMAVQRFQEDNGLPLIADDATDIDPDTRKAIEKKYKS